MTERTETGGTGQAVGFTGLGLMGLPMARRLTQAGTRPHVWTRNRTTLDAAAAEGMIPCASPQAVAEACDTVIVMVADTPAVEEVVRGPNGILRGLRRGGLVIDMGTTAVTATLQLAADVRAAGGDWLDAPVSGGTVGARDGTLSIMVGGSDEALARARPILERLGRSITHIGEAGAGQVAKAANQMIVGVAIAAVAEALTLARRSGADPAKVREALMGGFAASRVLDLHGQRMIDATFAPGGKATTQRKDLAQALDLADSLGLDLPITRLTRDLYDRLIALGFGELDHSALVKVIDRRTEEGDPGA